MSPLPDWLQQGLQFHQAGQWAQAEQLYRQILQADPEHAEALQLLGALALQTGHKDAAVAYIQRAIARGAGSAFVYFNLAQAYRALGRLDEARASYEEVLRREPGHADAPYFLALMYHALGRLDEARAWYEQAVRLRPDRAEAHLRLGSLYQRGGRLDEARACYEQALRLQPDVAEIHSNLGALFKVQGRLDEALACLQRAMGLQPGLASAHNNLGAVFQAQGRLDEARACYQQALSLQPDLASAHNNLGAVYQELGRPVEALACYQRALQLDPDDAQTHHNLGLVFTAQIRLDDAQACFEQALRRKPDFADAHYALGMVFRDQGRTDQARACFARAQALEPHDAYKINSALLVPPLPVSWADIHHRRRQLEDNLARLLAENLAVDNPPRKITSTTFHVAYHGLNDRDLQAQIARFYARTCPSLLYVAPHCVPSAAPLAQGQPLRVGFISKYFHNHPVARHYGGILRNLARDNLRVILLTFAGPDDATARSLRDSADAVVTLAPERDLDTLRRRIAAQELDVLFYTDIGMERWTYFLAFARLAPVQCVTGGHPVTTGIAALDYFISSTDLEPDDAADHYTEQLVRLHHLPSVFERPVLTGPPLRRIDFGLPEDATLYVCAQTLFKLHPDFDELAAEILRADPRGLLVLFDCQHPHLTGLLTDRLRATLGGLAERLVLLPQQPYERYLHLLTLADALLDSPHFSGGTTSFQALGVGAPVVTLPGRFMRGRVTHACYRRMGVLDCVARDAADYVYLAVRLANDQAWRAQVCGKIRAAGDVLFGNVGAVRELEAFFVAAVARARAAR